MSFEQFSRPQKMTSLTFNLPDLNCSKRHYIFAADDSVYFFFFRFSRSLGLTILANCFLTDNLHEMSLSKKKKIKQVSLINRLLTLHRKC